ncbi:helix-turn-helix domain-containing protein [Alloalcanivorax xenomutans]|uniref:AlbA family DNA-binding domain-containing protein n=1 Tax=Alloalcanivorax xenomutans TaxID=1094342 RepID=UPI001F1F294E|nr:ATP-binding protein [Alloalcanivorax xenomutans]MCE7523042.1 ATP-binding protein [Alloalcanivorax xenomutans]
MATADLESLLYESESDCLDFKRENYSLSVGNDEKGELLKDVLAFANAWRRSDAYILTGVKEVKGGRSEPVGIDDDLDDAQLQQFIHGKTNRPVLFSYSTQRIDGVLIGVIKIPVQERPVYANRNFGKVEKDVVYVRRGSSTGKARPDEVSKMGASNLGSREEPKIYLGVCCAEDDKDIGGRIRLQATFLSGIDRSGIPDYGVGGGLLSVLNSPNPDYFRELFDYFNFSLSNCPFKFYLRNDSGVSVSNVHVEILVPDNIAGLTVSDSGSMPKKPSPYYQVSPWDGFDLDSVPGLPSEPSTSLYQNGEGRIIEVKFPRALPGQKIISSDRVFFGADRELSLTVETKIYGEQISTPICQKLKIEVSIVEREFSIQQLDEMYRGGE